MLLRLYQPSDCKILAELFYHTVHTINAKDYSERQVHAWADGHIDLNRWNESFLSHHTTVAEINGVIAGFGDIDQTGYLDRLYVHSDYQRLGIATALCNELERSVNSPKIITRASITALGFFKKRGYKVVKEQQVQRHHIFLTNYRMEYFRP
ncbi:MAG: GNAT family N-acetyltransferase [Lachnospiraceae bacterium]|nr:GNAT family N-acetyltransferase [Lachnospiraceae bacterium]